MRNPTLPEKKNLKNLEDYSPEVLWQTLVQNHPEWLYNNKEQLNKYNQISFLED